MVVSRAGGGELCGTTTVVPDGAVAPWGTTTVDGRGSTTVSLSTVLVTHPLKNAVTTAKAITTSFIRTS